MENRQDRLQARTYIRNYHILDVKFIGKDVIIYRAEDMKFNREVLLHEYFPKSIARHHYQDDEQAIVYVDPMQSEAFKVGKKAFEDHYTRLRMMNNPSIPLVYELFESNETFFVSTKYNTNAITLQDLLVNPAKNFDEQQIGEFALNLIRVFVLLQQRGLQVYQLTPEIILLDKKTKEPIMGYIEYMNFDEQATKNSIKAFGMLLYSIMDKGAFDNGEPLSPLTSKGVYSEVLCDLVNRMNAEDSSTGFKTFQELQIWLQRYEPIPVVEEEIENPFSRYIGLAGVVLAGVFIYYIFSQERVDTKSMTWFDAARYHIVAYFDDVKGESALAQMYEKGLYVDEDIKEAVLWYKKAAHQGDVDAQWSLVDIYSNNEAVKDEKKAIEALMQLAKLGHLKAQKKLGNSYLEGKGIPKNYLEAKYWFLKAEAQGDAYACGAIGWIYLSGGYGIDQDYSKALEWFQKGMNRKDAYSTKAFADTKYRMKSLAATSRYQKQLQEYRLGYQFEIGEQQAKDHRQAIRHYMAAAKLGSNKAEFRLAQLHERSEQLPQDFSAALYWYKKAAEHGDALAYYRVSKLYRAGYGIQKNDSLALQWCQQAAERGVGVAQGTMGSSYEFGWGKPVNYAKARYWYELAIANGYANAAGRLEKLHQKIQGNSRIAAANRVSKVSQTQRKVITHNNTNKKVTRKNYGTVSSVNSRQCYACHGVRFEKRALGKSTIVANMGKSQIAKALKGYKYGTYGGPMRSLMKGQVARYSDAALERLARSIGR